MAEKVAFDEKAAVIQSKSHSVRVMLNGAETMFSASDILNACGIKYPLRWLSRNRAVNPDKFKEVKLPFPMMTDYGRREIPMVFVKPEVAKDMIVMTACNADIKNWLLNDVLTYRIELSTEIPAEPVQKCAPRAKQAEVRPYIDALNRRIDAILIELLELKKLAAESVEAGI